MKKLQRAVADKLHDWLEGIEAEELLKLMEVPSDASKGDLSLPCFKRPNECNLRCCPV